MLVLLIGGTVLGYLIGDSALTLLTGPGVASHEHEAPVLNHQGGKPGPPKWPERLGLLGGLVFLFAYL